MAVPRSADLTQFMSGVDPSEVGFSQGFVVSWNPDTGENVIKTRGATFNNVSVMDSSDIVTIRAGSIVGLLRWKNSYFVLGSIVAPGSDTVEARSAISFSTGITPGPLNQSQGTGTSSGYVESGNDVTFTTYSGRFLIMLTAQVDLSGARSAARFSYAAYADLDGANIAASDARAAMVLDPGAAMGIQQTVAYSNTHNVGGYAHITVKPAFKLTAGPAFAAAAIWTNRSVIVHPF
ncbi:hypothetical protein ACFFQW_36005 [Umezawaea endophytica]|uniref:Uncharacterized protein n=1 Tax=Umezawaea endophytica TaxID=1654476 RepID=A0A9X2ZZJ8_9PSEU|nr:hypothetical protein [Umezawaea endophytica]MCS7477509.1 hypothetical protein [Umezawaea endophytica]